MPVRTERYPPRGFVSRAVRASILILLGLAVLAVMAAALDVAILGGNRAGPPDGRHAVFWGVFSAMYLACLSFGMWLRIRSWRQRRLRVRRFNELLALTPAQFEEAVACLLRDAGYRKVERVGGPGDLAADITCCDRRGKSVVVQCKRYAPGHRVGSRDIQSFIGMVAVHHGADYGIFVTTSTFTGAAIDLAHKHGVQLIDERKLVRMVERDGGGRARRENAMPGRLRDGEDGSGAGNPRPR